MATSGFDGRGFVETFAARHGHGVDEALTAEAEVYVEGLKEDKSSGGLYGGYTSGAFFDAEGGSINSIQITEPYNTTGGGRNVSVYTTVDYMGFWEHGHDNIFTRSYQQHEVWAPTLQRKQEDMYLAHARAYAKAFNR